MEAASGYFTRAFFAPIDEEASARTRLFVGSHATTAHGAGIPEPRSQPARVGLRIGAAPLDTDTILSKGLDGFEMTMEA